MGPSNGTRTNSRALVRRANHDLAEGTGVEPATPCGASDFESNGNTYITGENAAIVVKWQADLAEILHSDSNFASLASIWPRLTQEVKQSIVDLASIAMGQDDRNTPNIVEPRAKNEG